MKRILVAFTAVALTGCISKATHQQELDATRAEMQKVIDDRDAKAKSLSDELANTQAKLTELQQQLAKSDADLAAAKAAGEKSEADLAAMMKDRAKLKDSVADMQKALDELSKRKAESDQRIAEFRGLLDRFKSLIDSGKLKVKIVDGRMVVDLASDVLFGSGSARLSPEGATAIQQVTGVLASIPGRKFQVEGHTDNVPIHTASYPSNWELAAARAITVVRTMIDGGMPPDRISAASFGEFKPAVPNDTVEGRASNRRISIVLLPDLASLPGFDELNKLSASNPSN